MKKEVSFGLQFMGISVVSLMIAFALQVNGFNHKPSVKKVDKKEVGSKK